MATRASTRELLFYKDTRKDTSAYLIYEIENQSMYVCGDTLAKFLDASDKFSKHEEEKKRNGRLDIITSHLRVNRTQV